MRSPKDEFRSGANSIARSRMAGFIALVFLLSWPFLLYGFGWFDAKEDVLKRYIFSCLGMLMVAVSAFITRACIERQGFKDVGWNLGRCTWYLAVLVFCVALWLGPPLAARALGKMDLNYSLGRDELALVILSLSGLSLVAGFGEEFGWRGYLLPRLLSELRMARGAIVIVGFVWGIWHCAVAVGPLLRAVLEGTCSWPSSIGTALLGCVQAIGASVALSFIFGAVWLKTGSIFLCSCLHGCWIGLRDAAAHLFSYPSVFDLPTLVIVLVAWFIAYGWLTRHQREASVSTNAMQN
jgi:membrane protease YdiL (CAAX protease family)